MHSITLETLEELEEVFSDLVEDAFLLECIESWQRAGHLAPGDFSPELISNCHQRVLQYLKQDTHEVALCATRVEKQYNLPPEERKPAPDIFLHPPAIPASPASPHGGLTAHLDPSEIPLRPMH